MANIPDAYSRSKRFVSEYPFAVVVIIVFVLLVIDVIRRLATGQLTAADTARLVWRGVVNGIIIAIASVGLSMTYSILNFANFAHGDYITSGAFAGWGVTWAIAGFGVAGLGNLLLIGADGSIYAPQLNTAILQVPVAIIAGLVVAAITTIVISLVIDRLAFRPLREAGGIPLLITSIGIALVLRYLIVFIYGTRTRTVTVNPAGMDVPIGAGTLHISTHAITVIAVSLALMFAVHVVLQRTKLGTAMRAMADNKDLARVTGIPTERVVRWTWIIGGGLAGVAGYLLMLEAGTIAYNRGWILLLPIFAAVILGGIGSIYGAMYGGFIIGLTEAVSIIWLPSGYGRAAAFIIMILVLLFRPQGLFAGRSTA